MSYEQNHYKKPKGNALLRIVRQRFKKINWGFVIFLIIVMNLATMVDGDFFDWKLNAGLLLMVIMATFMYE
jgi:hypothetical protein